MSENATSTRVNIYSEEGNVLMAIDDVGVEGSKLFVDGELLGSFTTRMYMAPQDLVSIMQIVLKHPEIIKYALDMPALLKEQQRESA